MPSSLLLLLLCLRYGLCNLAQAGFELTILLSLLPDLLWLEVYTTPCPTILFIFGLFLINVSYIRAGIFFICLFIDLSLGPIT
jgi:hypothetical protein